MIVSPENRVMSIFSAHFPLLGTKLEKNLYILKTCFRFSCYKIFLLLSNLISLN